MHARRGATPVSEDTDEPGTEPHDDPWTPGRVLDAAALRALAHPLRFQLVELLIEHGPSTATELGRLVDESSGLTSYHLRELAKHDLIEEAHELGSARDRYWQPVKGGYTLAGFDMLQQDTTRADAQFVLDEVVRARVERLQRWHGEAPLWGVRWAGATMETTARLRLTRDELGELTAELVAVVDRFRERQAGRNLPGANVPEAVPVTVQIDAFPTGEPPTPAVEDR
jgi:DNA-binding transcriptional ArsR family regulator